MTTIQLYPGTAKLRLPGTLVEQEAPLPLDSSCTRCGFHEGVKSVCMKAEGKPGGVLILSTGPGRVEDQSGRPHWGTVGKWLRTLIHKYATGPIAFDHALKCAPGRRKIKPAHFDACRPYLAKVLEDAQPSRVIALGSEAVWGLRGHGVLPFSTRRGYMWLLHKDCPVFFLPHPARVYQNALRRAQFERELKWALTCSDPPEMPWDAVAHVVDTVAMAKAASAACRAAPWVAFDVETWGEIYDPGFRILCASLTPAGSTESWVWRDRFSAGGGPFDVFISMVLEALLEDPDVKIVGSNVKYDVEAVREVWGCDVTSVIGDVRLLRKLLDADASGKLADMADLVGMGGHKKEAEGHLKEAVKELRRLDKTAGKPKRDNPKAYAYAHMPEEVLLRYNALDTVATARLGEVMMPKVESHPRLGHIWRAVVRPASKAIADVEAWGIPVDRVAFEDLRTFLEQKLAPIDARFDALGGLNPNSPKQLKKYLFETLKLRPTKLTPTRQPSTDASVLLELAQIDPSLHDIIDWRKYRTVLSTYVNGLIPKIRADGRLHPTLLLDGAESGRLSCQNPNCQNLPNVAKRPILGKMVRDCFVASPGYILLQADYSQVELRVAAMLSGDPAMIAMYQAGEDFHMATARLVARKAWGIEPDKVTKAHRSMAKTIVFGVLYGKTAYGLSFDLGCSPEEAEVIYNAIMGRFARLRAWCSERLAETRKTGEAWTWWDGKLARRRPLWNVASPKDGVRKNAEKASWNTPTQGTANEFCLRALVDCVDWIHDDAVPTKLILPVHDALLFEVEESAVAEVAWHVDRIMTSYNSGPVPMSVDQECGLSWGSLQPYVGNV